ncbi:restriction endonuclease subunit S [Marinobacter subterrani]|uniref:Restriction endonuclease S subunit n=1 Tax=Marinobacter subterrani TaxID=1658765 RepID=A0A0J7LWP6_9GAMM|nr:restriction endonuclease subunit S [Marinobacter subterrani]KMQ73310.1 Restriction endonuclease S subunit [Marinobacter subterrani]
MSFDSASNWTLRPLGECIDLIIDHRGKTPRKLGSDWVDSGVPTISAKNVSGGKLVAKESIRFVSHDIYKKWMKEDVRKGDCLLVSEGATLGECLYWDEDYPVVLGQRIFCIRANPEILNPRYLYAYMTSEAFQQEIRSRATGSSVPGLRQTEVLKLMVLAPPLDEQAIIGDTLFSVNEKIKSNTKTNQTLEQIAQAIFKSWFVDFEPAKAKIAALEAGGSEEGALFAAMQAISDKGEEELTRLHAEQPEQYAELRATAELFPSAMQDSELGEIPDGWTVGTLADVANLNQQSWTKRTIPSEIRYVDLANTKNGVIESTTTYLSDDTPSRARRILSNGDTIVGTVRPGNRSFAFIKRPQKTLTGSTGFAVLSPKQAELAEFVYITATSDATINHLAHLADGGAYPAVRPEVVINLPCIVPNERLIAYFHKTVRSFFDQAAVHKLESSTLSVLRDMLLPKLLSGELSVLATDDQLAGPANV